MTIKFQATIRKQQTPLCTLGRITSTKIAGLAGKKVNVTIEEIK